MCTRGECRSEAKFPTLGNAQNISYALISIMIWFKWPILWNTKVL